MTKKILGITILGMICWCAFAAGQGLKPSGLYFNSVEHNSEAADIIAKAKTCVANKNWSRAIKLYQYLAQEYQQLQAPIYPNVYVSMNEYCLREIAKLPPEALKAYREGMGNDAVAGAMFDRGIKNRDFKLLEKVADEYFLSSAGDEAAKLVADNYLEQGLFDDAIRYYEKILEIYPDTNLDKHTLMALQAVLRVELGQMDRAQEIVDQLAAIPEKPLIDLAGEKLSVENFQKRLAALGAGKPVAKSCFAEGELSAAYVRWSRYFYRDYIESDIEIIKREYERNNSRVRNMGPRYLPTDNYFATWRDGKALLPRNNELFVFDGINGNILRELRADMARAGTFVSSPGGTDWRDGVVFFNSRALITNMWLQQFVTRRFSAGESIVGYDFNNKAPLVLTDSPQPDAVKEQLSRMVRASEPLLRGDRLYSAFAIPSERSYELYVCAFSALTGKNLWKPQFAMLYNSDGYNNQLQMNANLLEQNGKLYLLTNTGLVACYNAYDGKLNWLTLYPARQGGDIDARRMGGPAAIPLPSEPIYLTERALVIAPRDSDQIITVDRLSGRMFNSFFHEGKKLIGVNERYAYLIDTPNPQDNSGKVTVVARGLTDGRESWRNTLESGKNIYRAVRDGNILLVPTAKALYGLDAANGKCVENFQWRDAEQAGNIEIGNKCLIVTAPYRITAIYAKSEIERLEQLSATHKDDLPLRLEITKIRSFNQTPEKSVVELTTAADEVPAERLQDKVIRQKYDDLRRRLVFLQLQMAKGAAPAVREACLRSAVKYSADNATRAGNLLRLAEFFETNLRWTEAVDSYQEVLVNTPEVIFVAGGMNFAGAELARQAIAQLIAKQGRAIYDKYEKAAQTALSNAKSLEDFGAVINTYPNSLSLYSALVEMSRLYAEKGEHRQAIVTLQTALRMFPNGPRDQDLIYCLTQHFVAEGAQGLALAGANILARDHSDKVIAVGDKKIPVADYVKGIRDRQTLTPAEPAPFDPKQQPLFQIETKSKSSPLAQRGALNAQNRHKLFVYDDHLTLTAYDTNTGQTLWNQNTSLHPWMGIMISNAEVPGVSINKVLGGTPADKGGIKDGDIVVKFNNTEIENSEQLIQATLKCRIGDTVKVGLLREGKQLSLDITLAHRRDVLISYQFLNDRVVLIRQLDMVALSLADGKILWHHSFGDKEGQLFDVVSKNGLALCHIARMDEFGQSREVLVQLVDLNSGIVAWRQKFGNNDASPNYCILGDSNVAHLIPGNPSRLLLFDYLSGKISAEANANKYFLSILGLPNNRVGLSSQGQKDLNIYDLSTGKLTVEAKLPELSLYRGLYAAGDKLFLFGNQNIYGLDANSLKILFTSANTNGPSPFMVDIDSDERGLLTQSHNYQINPPIQHMDMYDTVTGKKLWQREFEINQPLVKMKLLAECAVLVLRIAEANEAAPNAGGARRGMGGGGAARMPGRAPLGAKVELPPEAENIMVKMLLLDRQTGQDIQTIRNDPQDPFEDFVIVNGKICGVTGSGNIVIFGENKNLK